MAMKRPTKNWHSLRFLVQDGALILENLFQIPSKSQISILEYPWITATMRIFSLKQLQAPITCRTDNISEVYMGREREKGREKKKKNFVNAYIYIYIHMYQ